MKKRQNAQKPKVVYHVPQPGERKLWDYRQGDQRQIIRVLWPSAEYRSEDQQADQFVERLLWPSNEDRPADQQPGTQVARQLWDYRNEEPEEEKRPIVKPAAT